MNSRDYRNIREAKKILKMWKEGTISKEMQLTAQPDGKWKLKTFTMGAANKTETYPKAMIDEALRVLGLTWQQADTNSQSGEALEVFMNKNNPGYYYHGQIDAVLVDLLPPSSPYIQQMK